MSDHDRSTDLARALKVLLGTAGAEAELDFGEIHQVATLAEAGVRSADAGLVLRFADGTTFRLTIRHPKEQMTMDDLEHAFIEGDRDVPQVRLADITEALMDVGSEIEVVMDEVAHTAYPTPEWLADRAAQLRQLQARQNELISTALGTVANIVPRPLLGTVAMPEDEQE